MTEETSENLFQQLKNFLFETAKIVAAISVIAVPVGWITIPLIDSYIDNKIKDFVAAIDNPRKKDVVEFRGNGIVMGTGPYAPGDKVKILYLLKSNTNCRRDVEVRWIGPSGTILTDLTTYVSASQATVSEDFIPFLVTLKIPKDAPEGVLIYAAIIRPLSCPDFNDQVVVPLSTAIEVRR